MAANMNKKLTLNIDDNLIKFAHNYSKKTKQSISTIVEKYLSSLKTGTNVKNISTDAKELYGILENKPLPYKKEMRKKIYEKSIN